MSQEETKGALLEESAAADGALAEAEAVGGEEALYTEEELREVRAVYPDFDPNTELSHPVLGALLRGEAKPTLKQLYEAVHGEELAAVRMAAAVREQVEATVSEAVSRAVETAVRETEERIIGHIRARGQRPSENGITGAPGIRMHPAVNRLTRKERAMLARRAENGETIQF